VGEPELDPVTHNIAEGACRRGPPRQLPDELYSDRIGGAAGGWRLGCVGMRRGHRPQTLRSKEDVLKNGYKVVPTDVYTN